MPTTLADLTTLRLGGPAARVVEATALGELVDAVRDADAAGEAVLIVGGGSNLVVGDDGWDGVVVLVRSSTVTVHESDDIRLLVDAGVGWDDLVARSVEQGWSGLAAMSGIPGLTGATPIQNVGAYGREVAEVISSLTVLDRRTGVVEQWPPQRCEFGFRTSAFKHTDRYVVLQVAMALERSREAPPIRYAELARTLGVQIGGTAPSTDVREAVLRLRAGKGMVLDPGDHDTWSVGSFFVNPLVDPADVPDGCPHWEVAGDAAGRRKLSAGWLIETAGFGKGFGAEIGRGRVTVSTKHSLALTNRGDATTAELLEVARAIRAGVEARYGLRLRPEAHLVGVEL